MGTLLLVGHLVFVGWLTLRPLAVPWVAPANVELLATIRADIEQGPVSALRGIGGNLLMFAPLGALLPLVSGQRGSRTGSFLRTFAAAGLLSLSLEALRSAVPGQVADVDSVLLHTAGAAVAHLLCYPLVRSLLRDATRRDAVAAAARRSAAPGPSLTGVPGRSGTSGTSGTSRAG
ncbi:VanZ family protein, partial [Streptomyces alkaliterrae]|uniref:VanZ family protein n=1 Tax=Streptomyces alkaliterrae TaxID=2213162 RepID=UPI002B200DAC